MEIGSSEGGAKESLDRCASNQDPWRMFVEGMYQHCVSVVFKIIYLPLENADVLSYSLLFHLCLIRRSGARSALCCATRRPN